MGVNLKEDENLVQVEGDGVEKGEDNLGDKVELESEEEVLNGNSLSEGLCAEQPAEEQPEKADVKSEIKEKVIGEPEEEKLGEVVDDDALGADWGLVINQADLIFECLCDICMLLKIQWCCTKQPIANLRCRTGPNIFRRYADDDDDDFFFF